MLSLLIPPPIIGENVSSYNANSDNDTIFSPTLELIINLMYLYSSLFCDVPIANISPLSFNAKVVLLLSFVLSPSISSPICSQSKILELYSYTLTCPESVPLEPSF